MVYTGVPKANRKGRLPPDYVTHTHKGNDVCVLYPHAAPIDMVFAKLKCLSLRMGVNTCESPPVLKIEGGAFLVL